jgi:hypothetical protein
MTTPRLALAVLLALPIAGRSQDPKSPPDPNFLAEIRAPLVNAAIGQTFDRPEYISEQVYGAQVTGSGRSQGAISVTLVPSPNMAVLDLNLRGVTNSRTVGVKGRVQVYTNNLTTFAAVKRVCLTPEGASACPAGAAVDQDTDLACVTTSFKCRPVDCLTRRVAGRVFQRKEEEGEREGAGRIARRLEEGFDKETGEQLAKANESFRREFREPLEKRGIYPDSLAMSTTADAVHVRGRLGATPDLSAPPPVTPDSEVAIRVHESLPNTASTRQFGGKTYDGEKLTKEFDELFGPRGKKDKKSPPKKADTEVEITFAKVNPIETRFRDSKVSITIHGTRFKAEDEEYEAMDITARYVLRKTAAGLEAVREKELVIVPPDYVPGKTKLKSSQIALRRILQRRLDPEVFPERFDLKEITPTGDLAKLGTLVTTQAEAIDGWLVIGLKRSGSPVPAAPIPPTP